jgi:hypothetical protein
MMKEGVHTTDTGTHSGNISITLHEPTLRNEADLPPESSVADTRVCECV